MLSRQKIEPFNALVESTAHDTTRLLCYSLHYIEVPENVGILRRENWEGEYRLYGRTENFLDLDLNGRNGDLETATITLDMLDSPRTLVLKDGRVFVSPHSASFKFYERAIPGIVVEAGKMFKDKEVLKEYLETGMFRRSLNPILKHF